MADAIGIRYLKKKMIMTTTPGQEAELELELETTRSEASLGGQIEYERLTAEGTGASREQRHPLTEAERGRARRERRAEKARGRKERREIAAATIWMPALGVAIRDGNVYVWELLWGGPAAGRLLGPLAWAHAEATDGAAAGPGGLLAGLSRRRHRGVASVAFPDGNFWKKEFTDASSHLKAKAEAVRFNILAVGAAPETRPARNGVASDLERLAALHTAGALDDEEFRQAKVCALSGKS